MQTRVQTIRAGTTRILFDRADGRVFLAPSYIDNDTVGSSFKLPIRRLCGRRKDGGKDRHY